MTENETTATGYAGDYDAPGLGAAAIAAALTALFGQGPFDLLSVALGATLMSIIFAYEWKRPRPKVRQSIAFGTVVALAALPILGYAIEVALEDSFEPIGVCRLVSRPCEDGEYASRATALALFACWLGVTILVSAGDVIARWWRPANPTAR